MVSGSSDNTPTSCSDFVKLIALNFPGRYDPLPDFLLPGVIVRQDSREGSGFDKRRDLDFPGIRLDHRPGREAVGTLAS